MCERMTKNGKPKRCRICKVEADVDSSGRCPGCACVAKAEAWGMHYGDYMAMRLCDHLICGDCPVYAKCGKETCNCVWTSSAEDCFNRLLGWLRSQVEDGDE